MKIPRILHHIWLGDEPMPDEFQKFRQGWIDKHPVWEFHLWTEKNLPEMVNRHWFGAARQSAEKSDILRYEILLRFGGVYVDADFECLKCIEPLISDATCFLGEAPGTKCQAIFGAVPNDPYVRSIVDALPAQIEGNPHGSVALVTGPFFIWRLLPQHRHVTLFESKYLYPYGPRTSEAKQLWAKQGALAFPDAYAVHHWAGSWRKKRPYDELRPATFRPIKCLMAENQRRLILESIPPGGAMLEWGSGGTTVWIADRMDKKQRLVSVEQHPEWAEKIRDANSVHANYAMRHIPPSVPGEEGKNATPWEENPTPFSDYINQPDICDYDVFLVDGVARGACLMKVFAEAKSGSKVFLHDANRHWYDWALQHKRIRDAKIIKPQKGGYPPLLWSCELE